MTFKIPPNNRKIIQTNKGDVFGNVNTSFGLDLRTNQGKFRSSRRMYINTDENESQAGSLQAAGAVNFVQYTNVNSNKAWYAATDDGGGTHPIRQNFVKDPDPTDSFANSEAGAAEFEFEGDDMVSFNGTVVCSGRDPNDNAKTTLSQRSSGGTWTTDWLGGLSGGSTYDRYDSATPSTIKPTSLSVIDIGSELLCFGYDFNKVGTVTTGNTPTQPRLTLDTNQQVIRIINGSSRAWILCRNTEGREAFVYAWDGGNTNTIRKYPIGSIGALAGEVINGVPYIVTADGAIVAYNGSGFKKVAALPTYAKQKYMKGYNAQDNTRFVHPKGTDIDNGRMMILIRSELENGGFDENTPSGIWEFDPQTGNLYCRYALGNADGTDWGQWKISYAGGLVKTYHPNSRFLAGGKIYTDNSTTDIGAIFNVDDEDNHTHRSFFTTPELHTGDIQQVFSKLSAIYRKYKESDDEMIVKVRTERDPNYPQENSITWSSSTEFTTTDSSFSNVSEGEEVTTVQGENSGTTAHIDSISLSSGTYTVTLDENIGSSSGSAKIHVNNFQKITVFDNQNRTIDRTKTTETNAWAQFKIEMRGKEIHPEINRLIIGSKKTERVS